MAIRVDQNEALIYLGYKGGAVPEDIRESIRRCTDKLSETAVPRTVWRQFELSGRSLSGTSFSPQGRDVWDMLGGCGSVILMAATLGSEVEALIRRTQVTDPSGALILDACASSAIEAVCDDLCAQIEGFISPMHLTDRFSPGYGDFPLSQQPELFRTLDITRRIGVTLTESGLMLPQKTVTAVMGVSPVPVKKRSGGCAFCNMFENCQYRKDGVSCGKS